MKVLHTGFNFHHGDRVEPDAYADLEELAQYIRYGAWGSRLDRRDPIVFKPSD